MKVKIDNQEKETKYEDVTQMRRYSLSSSDMDHIQALALTQPEERLSYLEEYLWYQPAVKPPFQSVVKEAHTISFVTTVDCHVKLQAHGQRRLILPSSTKSQIGFRD